MGVPFAGAALFTGLTGLPHPDWFVHHATWLMNSAGICAVDNSGIMACTSQAAMDATELWTLYMLIAIVGWLVLGSVFQLVAMCLYKSKVHDNKPPIADGNKTMESGKFHFGLFECFSNLNECLCSFCCTGLRFADTHASVTTTGFWTSFFVFFIVNSLISALGNAIAVAVYPVPALHHFMGNAEISAASDDFSTQRYIFVAVSTLFRGFIFGLYSRGEIRKKLGSPETDAMSKAVDVLSWACCFPCAMTQEAVEVDMAADVHIACPWTLTIGRASALGVKAREVAPAEYEAMVGDAVLLDGR